LIDAGGFRKKRPFNDGLTLLVLEKIGLLILFLMGRSGGHINYSTKTHAGRFNNEHSPKSDKAA